MVRFGLTPLAPPICSGEAAKDPPDAEGANWLNLLNVYNFMLVTMKSKYQELI